MDFLSANLLTILILVPLVGTMLTLMHHAFWKREAHLKWVTLAITLFNFLVSLILVFEWGVESAE
ncbi:MAG: hypothetical protein H0X08_05030, partial [Blastocatellia bacterium]|nr:hypothetical protein [Blastocatellia bacterium]